MSPTPKTDAEPAGNPQSAGAAVHVVGRRASDEELLGALREGQPWAHAALYDRFQAEVNRLVWRVLGADPDHDDLVQQVFAAALAGVRRLKRPEALSAWMTSLTLNTVRTEIRRRRWRRYFGLSLQADAPEPEVTDDHDAREAVRRTYRLLDLLGANQRLALTLRYIDGQELESVAAACGCSLATVKRWLARAEAKFLRLAQADPVLGERLARGGRWGVTP